jgi:hypothetical protein
VTPFLRVCRVRWPTGPRRASRCVAKYGAKGPDNLCARVCLHVCVCARGACLQLGASVRLCCAAAASMPSADDRAGDSGQAPAPWWPGMPGAVPAGLPFNPTPGGQALPSVPAGSHPPGTVWNADLGVAFTALWAAGFQAGQQLANPAVPGAVGAPGAPGAVAPTTAPPVGTNSK